MVIPFHSTAVGMTGFEPTTAGSQNQCSTKLRYIPIFGIEVTLLCLQFVGLMHSYYANPE